MWLPGLGWITGEIGEPDLLATLFSFMGLYVGFMGLYVGLSTFENKVC